jgi:uncharacterized protein
MTAWAESLAAATVRPSDQDAANEDRRVHEELRIPLEDATVEQLGLDSLGALVDRAEGRPRGSAILLAHGAGAGADHPWLETMAARLASRGFDVMRFHYPYMERAARDGKRSAPDRAPALESAHLAAIDAFRRRFPDRRVLLAGKSMGGRIATIVAAKGALAHGLVLLGYPLHPPKRPEKERSEHFASLAQPALFLQGTRDEFAAPDEIRRSLRRYSGRATLSIVDGGDHSFAMLASRKMPIDAVLADVADRVAAWEREIWPE